MDTIYGHQLIKEGLCHAARMGRLHHALLFVGPKGVGKMSLARAFVKMMYCENTHPEQGIFCACGKCGACVRLNTGKRSQLRVDDIDSSDPISGLWVNPGFPDVLEVEEDDPWIKVATMRAVSVRSNMSLNYASHRYIIIRDAHKLRDEAANAFLKTLEEPNPDTSFILTTSNLNALLPTIVSRCQVVRFAPFNDQEVATHVQQVVAEESARLQAKGDNPADVRLPRNEYDINQVVNMAFGSFGEADKFSFGEEKDLIIRQFQQVISLNSSVDALKLAAEFKHDSSDDKKKYIQKCIEPLFRLLLLFLRDILLRQAMPGADIKLKHHLELIDKCAKSARPADVQRSFDTTQEIYNAIVFGNANEQIAWERLMLGFQGVLFRK